MRKTEMNDGSGEMSRTGNLVGHKKLQSEEMKQFEMFRGSEAAKTAQSPS